MDRHLRISRISVRSANTREACVFHSQLVDKIQGIEFTGPHSASQRPQYIFCHLATVQYIQKSLQSTVKFSGNVEERQKTKNKSKIE